jgi:biotin transporter BioY
MVGFLLWLLLLVFCWPLALLALVLYPVVWLISLPFRLVGITLHAVFAFLAALLMLPARVLRGRPA